jgi:hypothetical protein
MPVMMPSTTTAAAIEHLVEETELRICNGE